MEQPITPKHFYFATRADRPIVERPRLAPHLEPREIGGHSVILASQSANRALYGQLYVHLVPLLDGTKSRHDITRELAGRYTELAIQAALVSLATKGYTVSAEYSMDPGQAAFWSSFGVTPRCAEERLAARTVTVEPHDEDLSRAFGKVGVRATADGTDLAVCLTRDYIGEENARRNRQYRLDGKAWTLVNVHGMMPMIGPVFIPDVEERFCWACLEHRLRGNLEVENFLRHTQGEKAAPRTRDVFAPLTRIVTELAAIEIAKWIVLAEMASIHSHVISLDPFAPRIEHHPVMRRPQCLVCGDESLYRTDREPTPVRLAPSPKPVRNSGGARSISPEATIGRYRHLVSPVSGIVRELVRATDESDSCLHVYGAGSNLALKSDSMFLLRKSLRSKSSGKGSTDAQARASAMCEALERYSGVYHGDEIRRRACLNDFAAGEAIHPNDVQLYSDRQYELAAEINARGERFNFVPERLDPTVEMDWTPVWSVTASRHRYLPTSMLYFSSPTENGVVYCGPDSNGCAAGNTLEEAVLQGFFELVERDAFACWWYNRVRRPRIDIGSLDEPYLTDAVVRYASLSRELWVLDITHDLGIPVFVAVSRRTDKDVEDILFAAGAHLDPKIAALRAVCELNQYLTAVRDVAPDGSGYAYDDPELRWWWKNARVEDHPYLLPDPHAPVRDAGRYSAPDTEDTQEDIELCRSRVEALGMEFLVLDQTRPDLRIPVARTIVPGLRHFWARFGTGRLYEVPVSLGWLDRRTPEADLNPIAIFI